MALSKVIVPQDTYIEYLKMLESKGFLVGENYGFGNKKVTGGAHARESFHYDKTSYKGNIYSDGADINWPGGGAIERQKLLWAMNEARYRGISAIFAATGTVGAAKNHQGHLHVDRGTWSNFGKGLVKTKRLKRPAPPKPRKPINNGERGGTPLNKGDKGRRVRELQRHLNKFYPAYSKLVVDGDYGNATANTVGEFQRRAGLKPDKVAGPATFKALGLRY